MRLLISLFILFIATNANAATKTWKNGGVDHNWSTAGNWAEGSKPAAGDDVVMSAAYDCVVNEATANLNSFDMNGYSNTLSGSSGIMIRPGGAGTVICRFAGTISWTGAVYLCPNNASAVISFYSGGKTFSTISMGVAQGSYGTVNQMDAMNSSGAIVLGGTHFNSNGYSITSALNTSVNNYSRTLNFTNSTITCKRNGGNAAWICNALPTITMTGSTINTTGSFSGGGKTYNIVNITTDTNNIAAIAGANTFATLTITGTERVSASTFSADQTITGTMTFTGNSVLNRLLVSSSVVGTPRSLTVTGATVTATNNADISDIAFVSTGNVDFSGTSVGDCLGNSISGGGTLSFTASTDQHWTNVNGGNWSDSGNWTSRVPLPQDNAIMDCAFGTSKTVTFDTAAPVRCGTNIDWSGATFTTALTHTSSAIHTFYGNLTLKSGMTYSGLSVFTYDGRSSSTFSGNGVTHTTPITVTGYNGTLNLNNVVMGGALTLNGATSTISLATDCTFYTFTFTTGTFDTNDFDITTVIFNLGGAGAKTLTIDNSTITMTGFGTGAVFVINPTNTTFSGTGSNIIFQKGATPSTFAGGGLTYGTLTNNNTTGAMYISGDNTFTDIVCNYNGANAKSFLFTSGTNQTVGNFTVTGQAGKLITIAAVTAGSPATITASGTVAVDYASVKDMIAAGVSSPFYPTNSTNVSGNTNWLFTSPPGATTINNATINNAVIN